MNNEPEKVIDRPKSWETFLMLSEPMPIESLSVEQSRGFKLTSIKAAFVLERLNETFGLLGYGWRYVTGPHHLESAGGKEEVLVEVAVQWRITTESDDHHFSPPVYWQKTTGPQTGVIIEGWHYPTRVTPAVWSEPIFATGGSNTTRKGSVPLTDAYRASVTNAITKIASRMGVGLEVFKGQDELIGNSSGAGKRKPRKRAASKPKRPDIPKALDKAKAPAKAKAKANTAKPGTDLVTLQSMQAAVEIKLDKLSFEDRAEVDERLLKNLAQLMEGMGFKMQPARLIHCLLGEGPFSQKRVMATFNFIQTGYLTEENIDMLNKVAFPATNPAAE